MGHYGVNLPLNRLWRFINIMESNLSLADRSHNVYFPLYCIYVTDYPPHTSVMQANSSQDTKERKRERRKQKRPIQESAFWTTKTCTSGSAYYDMPLPSASLLSVAKTFLHRCHRRCRPHSPTTLTTTPTNQHTHT